MPDYSAYEAARNAAVDNRLSQHSLGEEHRSPLETCFLNGCWGDDNSNVLLSTEAWQAGQDVNQDGVDWRASNPTSDLPDRPPR